MSVQQGMPAPGVPIVGAGGAIALPWLRLLQALWTRTGGAAGSNGSFASVNGDPGQTFQVAPAAAQADAPPLSQVQNLDATVLSQAETYAENYADAQASAAQTNAQTYALQQIQQGTGAPFVALTLGASPYTYAAVAVGHLVIEGGTVTAISLTRGTQTINLPPATPLVPLDNGDAVKITYSSAPTVTWIPR